jgi:TRAP-type C4-dicarboxylate transport system permease small subunit
VSDEPDDKGKRGKRDAADAAATPGPATDIPETRKHDAVEAPAGASNHDFNAPMTYPDDGRFSAFVRKLDGVFGTIQRFVLFAIFLTIVLVGSAHALLDRFAHIHLSFKDDVIRTGTFAIAMLGGAFASQQAKHLSMDLLSRRFSPRNRLFLKVLLGLFVIFAMVLLIRSGWHNIENEKQFAAEDKLLSRVRVAWLIPIGGAQMILHTVLHMLIDVDYIARRKTPPERMRSGH